MDDKIVIKGVPPYDGEYPIDFETLTMGELHTIKRVSGVRAGEFNEALAAGDSDLVVAFALVAMERSGKDVDERVLWSAEAGSIEVEIADRSEEDDAGPPALAASSPPANSGASSEPTSDENLETDPSFTGAPV